MPSNSISSEVEQSLRDLRLAPLDPGFLSRLESAADGTLAGLTAAESLQEAALRDHLPRSLSPEFLQRLESTVSGVQFAVDDKIVLFPKSPPASSSPVRRNRYSAWAAAAAVALFGASAALFLPGERSESPVAKNSPALLAPSPKASNYLPAGFNRGLQDAADEGVAWDRTNRPLRVVRVTYLERTTYKNAEGKTVEIDQPRTEYILVPEKMD